MGQVFISYARKDRGQIVTLANLLHRFKFSTWWDTRLNAGQLFDEEIRKSIDACQYLIVVWSRNSVASKWVGYEVDYALEKGKKIIPLKIDKAPFPERFQRMHAITIREWNSDIRPVIAELGGAPSDHRTSLFALLVGAAVIGAFAGLLAQFLATTQIEFPKVIWQMASGSCAAGDLLGSDEADCIPLPGFAITTASVLRAILIGAAGCAVASLIIKPTQRLYLTAFAGLTLVSFFVTLLNQLSVQYDAASLEEKVLTWSLFDAAYVVILVVLGTLLFRRRLRLGVLLVAFGIGSVPWLFYTYAWSHAYNNDFSNGLKLYVLEAMRLATLTAMMAYALWVQDL